MDAPSLIAVMGPTASGKTALAERLADRLDAQLINADAFQIYRYLDVGTSKPGTRDRYELLDIRDPDEQFGVGEWVSLVLAILDAAWSKRRNAVVVGGTGLYVRALFEEFSEMRAAPDPNLREELQKRMLEQGPASLYAELLAADPVAAAKLDPRNPARLRRALERLAGPTEPIGVALPPFRKLKLAVDPPKDVLDAQIERRLDKMIQNGWVQEVCRLREAGFAKESPAFRAIGYLDIWSHIEGVISLEGALARIASATRRYAKRQRTWLRGEPRLYRPACEEGIDALFADAMERIA